MQMLLPNLGVYSVKRFRIDIKTSKCQYEIVFRILTLRRAVDNIVASCSNETASLASKCGV